jgi:putative ABC transport system permease protein
MVVRQGVWLAAGGVGIGILAAVALMRIMASFLFAVSPVDPITYSAVAAGLVAVAAAASYVPAYRASTINPVEALRTD